MASRRRSIPSDSSPFVSESETVEEFQEVDVPEIVESVEDKLPAEEEIQEVPAPTPTAPTPLPLFTARATPKPPVSKKHPRNIPRFSRTKD